MIDKSKLMKCEIGIANLQSNITDFPWARLSVWFVLCLAAGCWIKLLVL